MRKEEEENKETNNNNKNNNNNNNNINYDENLYNEELVFNCIKRVKVDGIPELLQHLNNISIEHLTSPSFINKLELTLKYSKEKNDLLSRVLGNGSLNLIVFNFPSNSLLLLEFLIRIGINIKNIIEDSQTNFIQTFLKLTTKIKSKIMLKNKKEEKAQLELVKKLIQVGMDIKGHEKSLIRSALESCNFKIIKYFCSQKLFFDIQNFNLHFVLQGYVFHWDYKHHKKQQNALLKLIKYLVDKGVDIHQRNKQEETILHLAAKHHSLKIIKYFISLGIDIHSLDNQKNTILLSTLNTTGLNYYFVSSIKNELNLLNNFKKVVKYFISIGVNVEHKNNDGMDAFLLLLLSQWNNNFITKNFKFIKFVASSMESSLKSPDRYHISSVYFRRILKSFNIEMIKYLNEFSCFANYFDGENKIKPKNSILFNLVTYFTNILHNIKYDENKKLAKFKKFKEIFEFFLSKRNNINSIDKFNRNAIQHYYSIPIANYKHYFVYWKFWDYLIEKGINLNHISNKGSILHYLLGERDIKNKENQEYGKYIMIRSMEINSQKVYHPKFKFLNDENTFEDFKRKDKEEEDNKEKVIKWKRGMAEILMKSPKILSLSSAKFKFDEKSSQLIKVI